MSKVHDLVTDQILASLEKGVAPWRKPWNTDGHRNLNSKRGYRGINRLLLEMYNLENDYSTNWWLTYNGAEKLGGNVKKGEKSHLVVFYKMIPNKNEEPNEDGEYPTIPLLRYYRVFNADQCENIEIPQTKELEFEPNDRAEEIISNMPNPPSLKYGGDRAYYIPPKDHVQIPKNTDFDTSDAFYCTTFHELVHSTGHESRLNRSEVMKSDMFGGIEYSKEELTAEIGAAMLGSYCGFDPSNVERSASYVKHWLEKLNDDKKMIVSAAGKAQAAMDYIIGENEDEHPENE